MCPGCRRTGGAGERRRVAVPPTCIPLAQRDVDHGLEVTLDYFRTREQQQRAVDILQFKLDILWSMLDAVEKGYPE